MGNSFRESIRARERKDVRRDSPPGEKQEMDPTDNPEEEPKKEVSREERLKKLQQLISARGDDAAKVLKMWMQQDKESQRRK